MDKKVLQQTKILRLCRNRLEQIRKDNRKNLKTTLKRTEFKNSPKTSLSQRSSQKTKHGKPEIRRLNKLRESCPRLGKQKERPRRARKAEETEIDPDPKHVCEVDP
jgi:hypothetical protein